MRKPDRVCLLDELRGLAVLLMIFYHGAYDAVYIFRFTGSGWFTSAPMDFLQRYIAVSFILIAGIMGRYSRSNFRRGVKTFLCGLLVTAVTLLVMPSERILFGILHFLGAAMMLLGLCEPLLRKIPAAAGVLLSAVLYLATDSIGQGWIGLGPVRLELPRALYDVGFLFPLGLHPLIFASADYYPLLPWIFLFLAGYWLGVAFLQRRAPEFCYREHLSALGWDRAARPHYLPGASAGGLWRAVARRLASLIKPPPLSRWDRSGGLLVIPCIFRDCVLPFAENFRWKTSSPERKKARPLP